MKIAVVGSREFKDIALIKEILINEFQPNDVLVSGKAPGVDSIAEGFIDEWNSNTGDFPKIIFKADWNNLSHPDAIIKTNRFGKKYDAKAGMRRNILIINEADKVIAFWDGKSAGTKNSIDLAIKQGKPLDIYVR